MVVVSSQPFRLNKSTNNHFTGVSFDIGVGVVTPVIVKRPQFYPPPHTHSWILGEGSNFLGM